MRRRLAAAAAALAVLGLSACGGQQSSSRPVAQVSMQDDDGLAGVVLPKPYDVPAVTLEDTAGRPYDLGAEARKPLTLVFFGYSHCPDICQIVMADLASAVTRLDPAQRRQVAMVFVTTDPARDDARALRAYLDRFNPSFQGLTGDLPGITRLGKALGVAIEKGQKLPSGGYDVNHGTQVIGVVPGRRAPYVWTEGTAPAAYAQDITKILDGKVTG